MDTAVVNINPWSDLELQGHLGEAHRLRDYAIALKVECSSVAEAATNDLSMIAKLKKAMDEKRREYTVPLEQHKKDIIAAFVILMAPIEEADSITRDKVLAFKQEQAAKKAEQERINAERLKLAQDEMALKGEISAPVDLIPVDDVSKRVSTDLGTAGMVTTWKFDITDSALVPDEYKIVDVAKIGKVVRAGLREIPGIRIYSEDSLRVTSR